MSTDEKIEAEIQAKGLTAPRVTLEQIEAVIASEHYFTALQGARMSALCERLVTADAADGRGIIDASAIAPHNPELGRLTNCVLVLKNGFIVTGESACTSLENFDAELGRKIARQNAVNKIWALEGYLLKQQLHDQQNR